MAFDAATLEARRERARLVDAAWQMFRSARMCGYVRIDLDGVPIWRPDSPFAQQLRERWEDLHEEADAVVQCYYRRPML